MNRHEAEIYRRSIEQAAVSLDDATALTTPEMFRHWEPDEAVTQGERLYYAENGKLYRVEQSHTTQAQWTPDVTPALFTEVSLDEWPEWVQPTGAQDAYMTGDKVSHNDKHWVSSIDNNVWEPGAVGTEALWAESDI